jgi:hypothetical protein
MIYSSQPVEKNSKLEPKKASTVLGPTFSDQRPSSVAQLAQQNMMRLEQTPNVIQQLTSQAEASFAGTNAPATRSQLISSGKSRQNFIGNSQDSIQKKSRLDYTNLAIEPKENESNEVVKPKEEQAKKELQEKIDALKNKRRAAKVQATSLWVKKSQVEMPKGTTFEDNVNIQRDEQYNAAIEKARKDYELGIAALHKEYESLGVNLISDAAYYGEEATDKSNTSVKFFKRPDNGKEYVKDMRGTFVPRYVRRERNKNDQVSGAVTSKYELDTYQKLMDGGRVHDIEGSTPDQPLSWAHREFMQQSRGGGSNQFALSHTSTKRPILSNDHDSFGTFDNGALLTDLAQVPVDTIAAQWTIDKDHGHKVKLPDNAHKQLGSKEEFQKRDKTVRMSGYRNMEVLVDSIPETAIAKSPSDPGWDGADWDASTSGNYTGWRGLQSQVSTIKTKKKKNNTDKKVLENYNNYEDAMKAESRLAYEDGISNRGQTMEKARRELEKQNT